MTSIADVFEKKLKKNMRKKLLSIFLNHNMSKHHRGYHKVEHKLILLVRCDSEMIFSLVAYLSAPFK